MPISVRIPSEKIMTITINWSLAAFSCPTWSTNADESTIRSSLASLDAWNSSLHWWFGFWTFWVAFGVALEVVFVILEYQEELHDLRRCMLHPPRRPNTALFVLGLLGAGLVAAGVSGEFWKESQIAAVETCIRKGNDALFLLLSKEAGDAKASSASAEASAKAADVSAGNAKEKVGAVAKTAGQIDAELKQMQWMLSARSVRNFAALIDDLKQYKGQVVHLGSYNTDDSPGLCEGLLYAAQKAELDARDECGISLPLRSPATGMVVSGPNVQQTLDISKMLLHSVNVGIAGVVSAVKAPELSIFVGIRPSFMIGPGIGKQIPKNKKTNKAKAKP